MNFNLSYIPKRSEKPRQQGVTMMMDKGLSLRQTEDFIESSGGLTDIVKSVSYTHLTLPTTPYV